MKEIDLQDLPSLAYQLLVVASKGPNRRVVVRGLLGFFGGPVRGPAAVVRQVEGTMLMHLNFAVKQDPVLGQEIVAGVRSDLRSINHFVVVVLFSIARVRRFNECSIGVLRSAVLSSRKDFRAARDSKWLPKCLKEECSETAVFVEKAFMKAINESNCGREHVVPSIVQFGFVLLELADSEGGDDDCSGDLMSIEELGISTLRTLFEVHEMARNEIIEQCKFQILSLKSHHNSAIIRLLGNLVQSYPFPILEYVGQLKELLDYFIFMHDKTATCLVNAILPLIKFSCDLQDYIILVVRKAMFRKEDAVRLAATSAVIDLILTEKKLKRNSASSVQESSSQASCSQQADIHCETKEGLFQGLSGLLRRCLSQQAGVKEIVYQGLVKLVLLDPSVSSCVFDFLWPHFLQFYKEDAATSLRLDNCSKLESGKISLIEPLDCLLSCVSWILLLQPHGKPDHPSEFSWPCFGFSLSQENEVEKSSSGELFANALMKIRRTLCKFRLGQNQESGTHSSDGEKTCYDGWILTGIIELIVNIIVSELEKSSSEHKMALEKEILELIDVHDSLEKVSGTNKQGTLLRKGPKVSVNDIPDKTDNSAKEGSRRPKFSQVKRNFLATSSIHQLLENAAKSYNAGNYNNQAVSQSNSQSSSKKAFGQCLKLVSFALKSCLHQIKLIASLGPKHTGDPFETLIYGDVKQLGRPIMQLTWLLKSGPKLESNMKKKEAKGRKLGEAKEDHLHLSLLCLNELFKLNSSQDNFNKLIEDLVSVAVADFELQSEIDHFPGSIQEQDLMMDDHHVKCINLFLEKRIKPLYSLLLSPSFSQETEVLSELFLTICKKLPSKIKVSHGNWVVTICRNSMIENPKVARSVVVLAIHLVSGPNDLILAHEMASELLKVMGSEDKEPIELSETFAIINHLTKTAIASVLLKLVESSLLDLDWAISKLKTYSASYHETRVSGDRSNGSVLEEALYSRTEALVNLLSCFAVMNLDDSQSEQLLRITAKFYKLLARMTKLCIAPKGSKQLLPGQKFQKLAEITCRKLTSPLYNFVALVQRNQQENIQSKGIISKIKRESKCIPELIFQIEDYERYLIQLSKLTKVNLLRHAKRSTARDFKILETKKPDRNEPSSSSSEGGDVNQLVKDASMESSDEGSTGEEGQQMVLKRKKTKLNKHVVQDSDEDM
ncbi:hypothetical protein J5N97_015257 [Dioscorea zingiberensis]|uniref:Fanconi anemia group I protein n=1 Tax=Dioscorea zingiberensis TaxID=325984 RepID=A0A9D5CV08_9LILI|nr:hypothetical protein J5N97_015257 [Dioscorea zingiberensis]